LNQAVSATTHAKTPRRTNPKIRDISSQQSKPPLIVPDEKRNAMLEEYLEKYHGVRRKKGVATILVPGEIEWKRQQERITSGIPISMALIKECDDYAEKIKIAKIREI
jgi:LDH2 family malate/lactate/ureidoglycolate dehydrogenase